MAALEEQNRDDEGESSEDEGPRQIDWSALSSELSADTLAALQAHMSSSIEEPVREAEEESSLPTEDYGMSQFWWDDESAEYLAFEAVDSLIDAAADTPRIAILSAPSVYAGFLRLQDRAREMIAAGESPENGVVVSDDMRLIARAEVWLLEYDHRFEKMAGDKFHFFDYNTPEALPTQFHRSFDYIFAGPPYVSMSCVNEYIRTFALLGRTPETRASIVIGATLEDPLSEAGFPPDLSFHPTYKSKFCTPMFLYRNYPSRNPLPAVQPSKLLKIASPSDVEGWLASGELTGSELDVKDGFIHSSNDDKIRDVARLYFHGQDSTLLTMDPEIFSGPVEWVNGEVVSDYNLYLRVRKSDSADYVRALAVGCLHVHTRAPLKMKEGAFAVQALKFSEDTGAHLFE